MKILHTADWHFGKYLYKHSLTDQIQCFLNWLLVLLEEESIDILLISGDVFDVTNPANSDKEMYFSFLKSLRNLQIHTIITGGNHDSVSLLNSSKEYLVLDNIHIVGGATDNIEDEIFHFNIRNEQVVIAAVPFLRDRDLRTPSTEDENLSREKAIKLGLQEHYQNILQQIKQKYISVPCVAMGHLFAIGSSTSDSERDIHIGNTAAVSHQIFQGFDYVALGHIHKPQIVGDNSKIRYSGSPTSLSFSEKKDIKQVAVVTVKDSFILEPELISVPKFRALLRFSGTLEMIKTQVNRYNFPELTLPNFIEVKIEELNYNLQIMQQTMDWVEQFNLLNKDKIINSSIQFKEGSKSIDAFYTSGVDIGDLTIAEVFKKRVESQLPDCDNKHYQELKKTFDELLEIQMDSDKLD